MSLRQESFTTFEAAEKLGVRIERLRDWVNRKYIVPDLQQASGRGTKGLFSRIGLYEIALFDHLLACGINRDVVKAMIALVKSHEVIKGDSPDFILHARVSEDDGWGTAWGSDKPLPIKDLGRYEDVYILNFSKIRKAVDELLQ